MDTAKDTPAEQHRMEKEDIEDLGTVTLSRGGHVIHCLTVIGQIEGHTEAPQGQKTTKYEHVIPQLVAVQEDPRIEGLLVLLNTVGGDVETGLALAELIASISKPSATLVLGGGHSIGIPLAVSARHSFIVPTATMTVHPVRHSGLILGVPQTMHCFEQMQQRITGFVAAHSGMPEKRSFKIMEAVRKGRGLPEGAEEEMKAAGVPDWYIGSCKKIKYLFPKAHAVAYVMMAFRIAWFKVYHPLAFYSAYFYRRSQKGGFDAVLMTQGKEAIMANIDAIENNENATDKDDDLLTTMEVVYEYYLRGFSFAPIDIYKSHATKFLIEDGKILPPFVAISGLGENAAWDLMRGREGKTFLSIEEVAAACPKVSKTHIQMLKDAGAFGSLPDTSQISLF